MMKHRRQIMAMCILAILLFAGSDGVSALAENAPLDIAKAEAHFVGAGGKFAIWQTSELIEDTRHHVAQSFTHRFYRQRIGEPAATLIYTERDTRNRFSGTVMRDGTTVLHHRSELCWISESGEANRYDNAVRIFAFWPDGVIISFRPEKQTYFVPFAGTSLATESKVKVPPTTLRHESMFAFISDARLHMYDLESGEKKIVALSKEIGEGWKLTAFDGETAMSSVNIFDAKTGRFAGVAGLSAFAVRNLIGYSFKRDKLYAIDLANSKRERVSIRITGWNPAYFVDAEGIWIWNGKKWDLLEWLSSFPKDSSKDAEQNKD